MYEILFRYADEYSNWKWCKQSCTLAARDKNEAIAKCKELYGLGVDCDYEIISIKEI